MGSFLITVKRFNSQWIASASGFPANTNGFESTAATKQAAIAAVDAAVATWLATLVPNVRDEYVNAPEIHQRYFWPDTGSPPDTGASAWGGATAFGFVVGEMKAIKAGVLAPAPSTFPTLTGCSPSSGTTAGGTIVTVTGTNLATAVDFVVAGAAGIPFTVTNDTTIWLRMPAHAAGSATLAVVLANANASTPAALYTYV